MKDASVGMTKEGEIGVLDEFHSFRDSLSMVCLLERIRWMAQR